MEYVRCCEYRHNGRVDLAAVELGSQCNMAALPSASIVKVGRFTDEEAICVRDLPILAHPPVFVALTESQDHIA
jgi:hypothetical protein